MPRILPTADQALIAGVQFAVEQLSQAPKSLAGAGVSERTVYRIAAGEATGVQANHWFEVLANLPPDVQANVLASLLPDLDISRRVNGCSSTLSDIWEQAHDANSGPVRLDPIGQTRRVTAGLVQAAASELTAVTKALSDERLTAAEQQQIAHLADQVRTHLDRLVAQTGDLIDRRKPAKR
jgi:hypothetical protein